MQKESALNATREGGLKLNVKNTILVGLAFFTITMFWEIYDNLMPLFLIDFDISATWRGVIMALDNILALVLLPFMGLWSDKFPKKLRQKFGRRIPFIICGSVLAAGLFLLVNYAHNARNLALMIICTVFVLLFMCFYRTPAVSLMPDVTPKPLRSAGNMIINIMGAVGTVITLGITLIPGVLKTTTEEINGEVVKRLAGNNWLIVGIIAAFMIIAAVIMVIKVKENKLVEDKAKLLKEVGLNEDDNVDETSKEKVPTKKVLAGLTKAQLKSLLFILISVFLWYMAYNGIKTHYSAFALSELPGVKNFTLPLLVANIAAFVMFYPTTLMGKKLGRKKSVMVGVLLLVAGFSLGSVLMLGQISASVIAILMYPAFILVGAGWATINVHSYVMSVEMATENTTGTFTGLYYTFAMGAQILTPILAGLVMDYISPRMLMPYALIFAALAFVTMIFVKHGNAKKTAATNEEKAEEKAKE